MRRVAISKINILKFVIVLFTTAFVVSNCIRSYSLSDSENENWNSTELAEGIEWHKALGLDERFESNQSYNAVEVDLETADTEVEFLWFYDRSAILSQVANQLGALAAINGTYLKKDTQFFKSRDSLYQTISDTVDHPGYWMKEGAVFSRSSESFDIDFAPMGELIRMPYPDIISAGPVLLVDNKPVGLKLPERPHATHENGRHPRTAIAVSEEGKRLILFTVDGRAEESVGLTTPELTRLLKDDFSVSDALNLDGGGTTTMWIREETSTGVVNYPSGNGKFDHLGERWTGQAIVLHPKNPEDEVSVNSEENCTLTFSDSDEATEEQEQYIYLGDQVDGLMDMPAGQEFSIFLWINPEFNKEENLTLFNKRIPEDDNSDFRRGYEAYISSDGYPVAILDTGDKQIRLEGEEKLEKESWSHVGLTLNGDQARLYVNGQPVAEETDTELRDGFANKFFLTAGAQRNWTPGLSEKHTHPYSPWGTPKFTFTDNLFTGQMDEFQVWHRALNRSEIKELAQKRLEGTPLLIDESALLSYWQFDELEGNLAKDATGNIHGTLMGDIIRRCK